MTSSVEQIKAKIDIVTVVSSYMKLEKAGANMKGKCPFHNEKTPSFFVSPERGSYYCFGCHAKGDIFTFVQEFEGLDFVGALKVLAERAGVELRRDNGENKTERDRLLGVVEQAVFFFERGLQSHKPAQDYLYSRGLTEATIKEFRIGYAPLEWRALHDFLESKGVSRADMLAAGLIKRTESGDKYYDTFRGRIMFPIRDSSGRTIGFSGRILEADDNAPKYLNSPETQLFNKSEVLFGLDMAKKEIRQKDYSVLVEGQMDLIMMHQAGIKNTVASSGTALTNEHLVRLRRLSDRIIMSFDGDSAGFAAANRSGSMALSLGMELKVAEMPDGKDPADLAKEDPEWLKNILRGAKHIIDFYTDSLLARGLEGRSLGAEIRLHVLPYVAALPSSIERAHFIKTISQKTFIKEDALWDDLKQVTVGTAEPSPPRSEAIPAKSDAIVRKIAGVILWQSSKTVPNLDHSRAAARVEEITGRKIEEIIKEYDKERDTLIFEIESYYENAESLLEELEELFVGLEEEHLKKKFSEVILELQKAESARNSSEVLKYLEECQRISQRINSLKQRGSKTLHT